MILAARMSADPLEDLLRPERPATEISSVAADQAWKQIVTAFSTNEMTSAVEQGNKFLADHVKASALQVLGVKVMISLAGGAMPGTTFEDKQSQDELKKLEAEREGITKRYNELREVVRENDATINRITVNRTRPVQEGTTNHLACLECSRKIQAAETELATLSGPIKANKQAMADLQKKANTQLKPMTLQLLEGLIQAEEIDAAVAIASTYVRVIGNDLEIATKQQDIVRLQKMDAKAKQIIVLLKSELEPLIARKLYWEASEKSAQFLKKVESLGEDADLVRMVRTRADLDPADLDRHLVAGERNFGSLRIQASLDPDKAAGELADFKRNYPDHPRTKELELNIIESKTETAEVLLQKMESDFGSLLKRFDPDKLKVVMNRLKGPDGEGDLVTGEVGLVPADARLVKSSLQGLATGLEALGKGDLPAKVEVRRLSLEKSVVGLIDALR